MTKSSIVPIIAMVLVLQIGIVFADTEPNDSNMAAEPIARGIHSGEVSSSDLYDYYKFDVSPGDMVEFKFTGSKVGYDIYHSGGLLFESDSSKNADLRIQTSHETDLSGYGIMVLYLGDPGTYSFEFDLIPQDDAGSGEDAANSSDNAMEIGAGSHSGTLDIRSMGSFQMGYDRVDVYKFKAGEGMMVNLSFESPQPMNTTMISQGNQTIFDLRLGIFEQSYFLGSEDPIEWFYFTVEVQNKTVVYNFTLTLDLQSDGGSGVDAPGNFSNAIDVVGRGIVGMIGDNDEVDVYHIVLQPGMQFHANEMNLVGDKYSAPHTISLYSKSGLIESSTGPFIDYLSSNETAPMDLYVMIICKSKEDYFIDAGALYQMDGGQQKDAAGNYRTDLRIVPKNIVEEYAVERVSGKLGDLDVCDAYRMAVEPGTWIDFSMDMKMTEGDIRVGFYDSEIAPPIEFGTYGSVGDRFCYNDLVEPHDAFFLVNGTGRYAIRVFVYYQNDSGYNLDAYSGVNMDRATVIDRGSYSGLLVKDMDNMDMYKIWFDEGQTLRIKVNDSYGRVDFAFYDTNGLIAAMTEIEDGDPSNGTYTYKAKEQGEIILKFMVKESWAFYHVDLNISGIGALRLPSEIGMLSVQNEDHIDLEWSQPIRAGDGTLLGYHLYRGLSKENLTLYKTFDPSLHTFSDDNGTHGTTYYYCIAAFNELGEGPQSNILNRTFKSSDRDKDGMNDFWEEIYDLDPDDPSDADEDPDGDGLTNLEEYEQGLDPKVDQDKELIIIPIYIAGSCCLIGLVVAALITITVLVVRKGKQTEE